ncbi:hypothetical protein [Adlercreutzia sp. ZJ141]|uniref:hypothetical protein n=1 Tax=Adlercreutzia sp. ZJ141 TaxID=2709406 RepID=UPI0013ECFB6C|nr:hypothetical protein [Adlercreutzia sp. ZJ141]
MASSTVYRNGVKFYSVDVSAWVSSETDTHAIISWSASISFGDWYLWGVGLNVYVNGTHVRAIEGACTSRYQTVCACSGSVTVAKGATGRQVSFSASSYSATVNGYGGVGSTTTASGVVAVAGAGTPDAVTGAAARRVSDNQNTVSWTLASSASKPYSGLYVERSINGGEWSALVSLNAGATSYADSTTAADCFYRYRIRPYNGVHFGTWSETNYTYNTPAAPSKVEASRTGETGVALALTNESRTATATEIQRSADKSTVITTITIDGMATSASDNPGGGTFYYRARNVRGSLASAWSPWSSAVITMCPPAAPTLTSPVSSATVSKAHARVVFGWLHNPADGSAQTAAQLQYSVDGGATWTSVEVSGSAQRVEVANLWDINSTVTWRVRTKGAHAEWGPWSANSAFRVCQVPSVVFAEPSEGYVIRDLPVRVRLQYSDPSGKLASAVLTVKDSRGAEVCRIDMGTATVSDIAPVEWFPTNGERYVMAVTARSTSTLSASASRAVAVNYVLPCPAHLDIDPDPETGLVSLEVSVLDDPELAEVYHVDVFRVSETGRVELAKGVDAGHALTDRYAPLNVVYSYECVTYSGAGAANATSFPGKVCTPWWFFYFGDGDTQIARGKWNPDSSWASERPSRALEWFAGRSLPVLYDDGHIKRTGDVSLALTARSERMAFEHLVQTGGFCVMKTADGDVMHAAVDVSLDPADVERGWWGTVRASWQQIDGRVL